MKLFIKCRLALLLTIVFSIFCITEAYAASHYIKINTLQAYKKSVSIDLNGDKKKDKIIFTCNAEYGDYTLSINGAKVKGKGIGLEGNFRVIDINTKDKYKEIAIQEFGESDDIAMSIYSYDGKKVKLMRFLDGYDTSINKTGGIYTNARGSILCTWFYKDYYKLTSKHTIQHVSCTSYPMNLKVTVKKPISLKVSPSNSKTKVILKKGEKVTIVSSDNKKWCLVKNSKGVKGWFAIYNFDQIIGTKYFANDVFEGLCYAD